MTQDEQLDRLERSLRLFLKQPVRESEARRHDRCQARSLRDRAARIVMYKQALASVPDDEAGRFTERLRLAKTYAQSGTTVVEIESRGELRH